MNGVGKLKHKNGKVIYKGGFKENNFDGFGVCYDDQISNIKEKYVGLFKNN